MSMNDMPNPAQSQFSKGSLPVKSLVEAVNVDPTDLKSETFASEPPSLHMHVPLALARFLISFSIGVAATMGWRTHGDAAKQEIANSFPQLGRLTTRATPVAQNTAHVIAPALPPPDQQQIRTTSLDLDAVRQSLDEIATSQEQMTRSLDQFAADQGQMTREITKLQEIEQSIRSKNSEPSPRPVSSSSPKPRSRPASAAKPVSPTPTLPEPTGPLRLQGTEASAKQRP
jgi:hypothetical protein